MPCEQRTYRGSSSVVMAVYEELDGGKRQQRGTQYQQNMTAKDSRDFPCPASSVVEAWAATCFAARDTFLDRLLHFGWAGHRGRARRASLLQSSRSTSKERITRARRGAATRLTRAVTPSTRPVTHSRAPIRDVVLRIRSSSHTVLLAHCVPACLNKIPSSRLPQTIMMQAH